MDNHAASTVADGQPLVQPLLLPSPLPPPAPPLSLSLARPFCVVSPAFASTVPTSPAPMCFEGWYEEVEAVTEGVNNLAITEQQKKNQIQVSNTKKELFFYVNLAKLHKHQRGYASLCEKLLGAKDGGVSSNSSQSDAAVSIPSSPIPVNGKLVEQDHGSSSLGTDYYHVSARSLSRSPVLIAGAWLGNNCQSSQMNDQREFLSGEIAHRNLYHLQKMFSVWYRG